MSAPDVRIIGIAGGSGSGKTTFARALKARLPADSCALIFQDNYYIDQSSRFDFDGGTVNFDHPDALDFPLLGQHLAALRGGHAVEIPIYDFSTHMRIKETLPQPPRKLVLVDGILIFHPAELRAHFDELVFFDTPEHLRFHRRLDRDVSERGRTPDGVHAQFVRHVKPMHDQFVEPTKAYASTVVRDFGEYDIVLEEFVARLTALVGG